MADGVAVTPGIGVLIAMDEIGGSQYQRVKSIYGGDGVNSGDVEIVNPFPGALGTGKAFPFTCSAVGANAATHNLIIAGVALSYLRVFGLWLPIPGDTTMVIEDSTNVALSGLMSLKAGMIFSLPVVGYPYFTITIGRGLSLLLGSAVQVGGIVLCTQTP